MTEKTDTALTYAQLLDRCAQLRAIAQLNHDTVCAQQRVYNEHINAMLERLRTCPPRQVRQVIDEMRGA